MHDDDCVELQLIVLQVEIDVLDSIYHGTGNHCMSIDLNQLLMERTPVSLNPFGFFLKFFTFIMTDKLLGTNQLKSFLLASFTNIIW